MSAQDEAVVVPGSQARSEVCASWDRVCLSRDEFAALAAAEARAERAGAALRTVQEDFRQRPAPGDGADAWREWQYHAGRTFATVVPAALEAARAALSPPSHPTGADA